MIDLLYDCTKSEQKNRNGEEKALPNPVPLIHQTIVLTTWPPIEAQTLVVRISFFRLLLACMVKLKRLSFTVQYGFLLMTRRIPIFHTQSCNKLISFTDRGSGD